MDRLTTELSNEHAANAKLLSMVTDTAIPAITKSTLVMEQLTPVLQAEMIRRQIQAVRGGDP